MTRWLALALLLACGDSKTKPQPEPAPDPEPPVAAEPDGEVAPDWQTRIPDIPGTAVLTWVNGPVVEDGLIQVGSNAIGVARVDARTGKVVEQDKHAGPFVARPDDLDLLFDDGAVRIRRDSVERASKWTTSLDEPIDVGISDPVRVKHVLAFVADGVLRGYDWNTGELLWRAEGRYATVEGAMMSDGDPDWPFHVVTLLPGRVGSRAIEPGHGDVVNEITTEGGRVVAADWMRGKLALVAHRDGTMRRTAVIGFDHLPQWEWDLPRPDGPRVDPIGVVVADAAVFVFYDGRYLVRLPL